MEPDIQEPHDDYGGHRSGGPPFGDHGSDGNEELPGRRSRKDCGKLSGNGEPGGLVGNFNCRHRNFYLTLNKAHRADCELEAESCAFIILNHFGIDSGDYSFGYVTSWGGGDENAVKALKACAQRIQATAKAIIDGISGEDSQSDETEEVAA